jgi:hypothetical protein
MFKSTFFVFLVLSINAFGRLTTYHPVTRELMDIGPDQMVPNHGYGYVTPRGSGLNAYAVPLNEKLPNEKWLDGFCPLAEVDIDNRVEELKSATARLLPRRLLEFSVVSFSAFGLTDTSLGSYLLLEKLRPSERTWGYLSPEKSRDVLNEILLTDCYGWKRGADKKWQGLSLSFDLTPAGTISLNTYYAMRTPAPTNRVYVWVINDVAYAYLHTSDPAKVWIPLDSGSVLPGSVFGATGANAYKKYELTGPTDLRPAHTSALVAFVKGDNKKAYVPGYQNAWHLANAEDYRALKAKENAQAFEAAHWDLLYERVPNVETGYTPYYIPADRLQAEGERIRAALGR